MSTSEATDQTFGARIETARGRVVAPQRLQMRELADELRKAIGSLSATTAPTDVLREATEAVARAAELLANYPREHTFAEFGNAAGALDGFIDHSPISGKANALAPPLVLRIDGDRAIGECTFGVAYEGAPGMVHGGYLAAAFDEILGVGRSMCDGASVTGTLTVRYVKPVPTRLPLTFQAWVARQEGRKTTVSGRLLAGEETLAEAEAIFISVDRQAVVAISEQIRTRHI
jgi:acyl-coenzyme A thioesterase PaaI-like protein